MKINKQKFDVQGMSYTIRSAIIQDATNLSEIRLLIDGETENLDREKGEAFKVHPVLNSSLKRIQRITEICF